MFLLIRMAVYFVLPLVAAYGFGTWTEETARLVITLDAETVTGFLATTLAGYGLTFGAGRIAKARGGAT